MMFGNPLRDVGALEELLLVPVDPEVNRLQVTADDSAAKSKKQTWNRDPVGDRVVDQVSCSGRDQQCDQDQMVWHSPVPPDLVGQHLLDLLSMEINDEVAVSGECHCVDNWQIREPLWNWL